MDLNHLVDKIKSGDKESFSLMVKQYQQSIYNLVLRIVGDKEEALDLTQEAFLKVYKNIHKYDPSFKLSTWIYRIASNTAIDYLRKKKDLLLREDEDKKDTNKIMNQADDRWLPDKKMAEKQLQESIFAKIHQLPEKYRTIIVLKYINELTIEEIAEIQKEPLNTVKSKLYRGREQLRSLLKEIWTEERGQST